MSQLIQFSLRLLSQFNHWRSLTLTPLMLNFLLRLSIRASRMMHFPSSPIFRILTVSPHKAPSKVRRASLFRRCSSLFPEAQESIYTPCKSALLPPESAQPFTSCSNERTIGKETACLASQTRSGRVQDEKPSDLQPQSVKIALRVTQRDVSGVGYRCGTGFYYHFFK